MSARLFVAAVLLCALVPAAHAGTVHVAGNGVDSGICGASASPCRTITQGIANAVAGDRVIVGPGQYSTETGAAGCGCLLAVNKPIVLTSSDGAASTVIDARGVAVQTNVLIIADGSQFGRPGKGFTVTHPGDAGGAGIAIDSQHVKVRGNQVFGNSVLTNGAIGIVTIESNPGPMLIKGNQVVSWPVGIDARGAGKKVVKNQVSLNGDGIMVGGTSRAIGNVVTGNTFGIVVLGSGSARGNAVYGNVAGGFLADGAAPSATIADNDIFENAELQNNCGLVNDGVSGLVAANNYWGAPTGPGIDPRDDVCEIAAGTTTTAPFATTPFAVTAPIKP